MSRSWKRANDEEQKQSRRRDILDAALELNRTCSFSVMSLADIARSASFTRSNLYKYFPCREDLFMALLQEEYLSWVKEAEVTFSGRQCTIKEFSHIWVDLILQHPRLIELLSLAVPQLEKEAGKSALCNWHETQSGGMERLNRTVCALFPSADGEDINEFLYAQTAQVTGMVPLLHLNDEQQACRKKAGLIGSRDYYREILCHAVESLLVPWVREY